MSNAAEKSQNESIWQLKCASRLDYDDLSAFYENEYNEEYHDPNTGTNLRHFSFDELQKTVDILESKEEIEQYDQERQEEEYLKCAESFAYFCHKYVKIMHPIDGLVPFILFEYQKRVIENYEQYRFNIISKFRQGGLTTVSLIWGLWRCMFKLDQQILIVSKTDREAIDIGQIVNRCIEQLPEWLKPTPGQKFNDHDKMFPDTGGKMMFHSPEAARGKAMTYLIIDEAAFIPNMNDHWKALYPTLSTGGNCIVISTVNGLGNWYEETFSLAREGKNRFNIIELDYWEHPNYNNDEWVKDQKAQLGPKGWRQEVLRTFLGSGVTYFDHEVIGELDLKTRDNFPVVKMFPKWESQELDDDQLVNDDYERGALWIWKKPQEGHEYIIGADCAEGMGENGDNSAFQVLDLNTMEQVAEFYSNTIPPHIYAQVLNEVGIYYHTALIVIENMEPAGGAVINNLQYEMMYEHLYYDDSTTSGKIGFKMNRVNRPICLETLQNKLMNNTIKINSPRLVYELKTFIYNAQTKRAEAQKTKHDDAIMALCVALFVRESRMRNIPVGAELPDEILEKFKAPNYQEIKQEIEKKGKVEKWIKEEEHDPIFNPDPEDILAGIYFKPKRKLDKLLREFGW